MKPAKTILTVFLLGAAIQYSGAQELLSAGGELNKRRQQDSVAAAAFLNKAESFAALGEADSVRSLCARSLEIASVNDFRLVEAHIHYLLGSICRKSAEWEATLASYLKAASLFSALNLKGKEAEIYRILGSMYYEMEIYSRAAWYFEQEFSLYSSGNELLMAKASEAAANALYLYPNDSLSVKWFLSAYHYYDKASDNDGVTRSLESIAGLYVRLEDYPSAAEKYYQLLNNLFTRNDYPGIALAYNSLGFIKFRSGDYQGAADNFSKALEWSSKGGKDPAFLADVHSNIAICHQALGQHKAMLENFTKALDYARESGREYEAARLNHILSVIYFRKGDNYHAELYCQNCIGSAKRSSNYSVLRECYQTYSEIMEKGNDFVKALDYYEKYLSIRDSLAYEERLALQGKRDRQAAYEDLEQRIRLETAEEEISGLALKRLKAESSRRENELKLLQKERELERSENERQSQAFALEKERFVLSLRDQEVQSLQQRQRSDSLLLILRKNETDALDLQNKTLEREKEQQALDIRKQKQIKRLAVGISILMVAVALLILGGLISIRRKNRKLAESKREIEKINTDLEMKNREVLQQKEIIEQKNQSITDSIQYAGRIQTAVLPPPDFLTEWGFENFILFKPKDIVSGDFYWGKKKEEKILVAAADCTGHGVPGAFMSMLGNAFLDEIINTTAAENAASVLDHLRDEVINALKQRGVVGETRDGMDISLCIIDRKKGTLEFAGANNPLYIIRDNRLMKIPADKMPIGIHVTTLSPFTNNTVEMKSGDHLYLFSDGYADQFGGPKGRKFMYKPFQDLLLRHHRETAEKQKELLDETFMKWKGEREQVDDVLVMGIKI